MKNQSGTKANKKLKAFAAKDALNQRGFKDAEPIPTQLYLL